MRFVKLTPGGWQTILRVRFRLRERDWSLVQRPVHRRQTRHERCGFEQRTNFSQLRRLGVHFTNNLPAAFLHKSV